MRQAAHERFPRAATVARAIDAKAAVAGAAKLIGLDGDDVDAVRISGMNNHGEAEVGRHAVADVFPVFGVIVGAIKAPVILQEEAFGVRWVHGDFVNALAEFGIFVGQEHGANAAILRGPG